jgi:hypothetical protein
MCGLLVLKVLSNSCFIINHTIVYLHLFGKSSFSVSLFHCLWQNLVLTVSPVDESEMSGIIR